MMKNLRFSEKRADGGRRGQKRQVVVETFTKTESGRLLATGRVTTEYDGDRRGGSIVDFEPNR
jgi:hypothetical protein